MKRFIIFFLILILSIAVNCHAGTYDDVLVDGGYTDIHNNYIDRPQLKSILEIIFKSNINYDTNQVGHSTGTDFFNMLEKMGYDSSAVENKEAYFRRALTFISLYELLDYYYPHISLLHGIETVSGVLSKTPSGYLLTYGKGKTSEFEKFDYFKVGEDLCNVRIFFKAGKITDVCPVERDIPISRLTGKKEIKGKLFLHHDNGIIIEVNGELVEYQTTSSFKFLTRDNQGEDIVLILGSYKKNTDMACVAVGRRT